ncbi:TauD/TfdA family dioxygenase [Planctobacterium marinum]|nr:TauD/TfdA family dioxygenase [Planctobacterium marinum]
MSGLASVEQVSRLESGVIFITKDTNSGTVAQWIDDNITHIRSQFKEHGCLLLRKLPLHSSNQFGKALSQIIGAELLEYTYRSTPRKGLKGGVYTATEYYADETILQHNENAYSNTFPSDLGFYCMTPAQHGGQTPICDSRKIYHQIPEAIRDNFEKKGILYVRNYSNFDLPWEEVFQTNSKDDVEKYCQMNDISWQWLPDNCLRTKQILPATIVHPDTGETIWFNQAHLFHVSALNNDVRSQLQNLGEENLPRNTYYGDGSSIDEADLTLIRNLYQENKILFDWQRGDLMILDNLRYTHGREPYQGNRKVLVGMSGAKQFSDLSQ